MSDHHLPQARSFGSVADAYSRGRPSYPAEAATWLTSSEPITVLELGAGTGKLTEQLAALWHDVIATEPDEKMLGVLTASLPQVRARQGSAEDIPTGDRSIDVVVAAQCFHWFDLQTALPEIARVLKPGGTLSVVWNRRDERIPWVRRLGGIIGTSDQLGDPTETLEASGLFGPVQRASFRFRQTVDRTTIQDLALSGSDVAVLDADERAAKLAEVLAFYDEYGRGMDGMLLPYLTDCFRAEVIHPPERDVGSADDQDARLDPGPTSSDGTDTDMLLIDFR